MNSKLSHMAGLLVGGATTFGAIQLLNGNAKFYSEVFMPVLQRTVDAETAHHLSVKLLSTAPFLVPKSSSQNDSTLETSVWGINFCNPVGMAAGFDKDAEAMSGLSRVGFGFVEVGSITPLPQPGNEKPRVFRLVEDSAVINRYGFNSCGHDAALKRLEKFRSDDADSSVVIGINLGKNKTSESARDDYVNGVMKLGQYGDYIVINVSSPNTPGLRDLQGKKRLQNLCDAAVKARNELSNNPPILVKIAPDLTDDDKKDISSVVMQSAIDGIIVSNTTISRPSSLESSNKQQGGGLSGRPLRHVSTALIKDMYKLTKGTVPIVGVGGIENGSDAYEKIRAGASLVQLYTAFTYHGPPIVDTIKKELSSLLKADGFACVKDAVGVDVVLPEQDTS